MFDQCITNVKNEKYHAESKFHTNTCIAIMVPENLLEDNKPTITKIE